jgi:hypothetical protein
MLRFAQHDNPEGRAMNDPKKMSPEELEQFIHRELRSLPARQAPAGFEARMQAKLEARKAQSALAPEQLEQLVHRELRALPLRKAPRDLEARVFAALEQRATVAWWHKSFSHWPAAARAAFLALATGVTGAALAAFFVMSSGLDTSAAAAQVADRLTPPSWISAVFGSLLNAAGNIPSLWLWGGLAALMAIYAATFTLGATAYRFLYRNN